MQGLCHYRTSEDYRLGWLWWLHKSMWDFCFFQRTLSNELLKWNAERQEGRFAQSRYDTRRGKVIKGQRSHTWPFITRHKSPHKPKNRDLNAFSVIHLLTLRLIWQIPDNTRKRTLWRCVVCLCILTSADRVQLSTRESQRLNWPKLLIGCFASIIALSEGDPLHCTPH